MKSSIKRVLKTRQIGQVQTYHLIPGTDAVAASLIVQDITYTAAIKGEAGNDITIAYTGGATAGAEVVTVTGNAISIQIQTAVSTATQVKAAFDAEAAAVALAAASISGTAGDAQVVAAAAALAGGVDPADEGMDKAFVESVVPTAVGCYTISMIEPARMDLVIAGLVPLTAGIISQIVAVDESSVSLKFVNHANSATEADFALTLNHAKTFDGVF